MWILLLFYLKVKLIIVRGKLHMIKSLFYSSKIKGLNKTTRLGFFFCHFIIYLAQIFYRCGMFFLLWKKLIHELNFLGCWFQARYDWSKLWFSKNRISWLHANFFAKSSDDHDYPIFFFSEVKNADEVDVWVSTYVVSWIPAMVLLVYFFFSLPFIINFTLTLPFNFFLQVVHVLCSIPFIESFFSLSLSLSLFATLLMGFVAAFGTH